MKQAAIAITGLPEVPLDAAAVFHTRYVPLIRRTLAEGAGEVVLVFAAAGHEHGGWRLAAIQELAREASPARVNGIAGNTEGAIAETLRWLEGAPGITGQLIAVG